MHLLPRNLGGQGMEWFSWLPTSIKIFNENSNLFVQQYSHNIQHLVKICDLCNLKQNAGEHFLTFLQRWQQLPNIHKMEKLDICTDNLLPNFEYKISTSRFIHL